MINLRLPGLLALATLALDTLALATLAATPARAQTASTATQLRFLPSNLEPGIEVSDDPLIDARVRAYLISFGRRAS